MSWCRWGRVWKREVWIYALRGFKGYRDAPAPAGDATTPPAGAQ